MKLATSKNIRFFLVVDGILVPLSSIVLKESFLTGCHMDESPYRRYQSLSKNHWKL